ncbi:thioredoxin [Coprinopsis marcescibilis]|uniref:Thioredoxin n=1 Tax=Coprinopsis marcescibilis TaxID=230819 RepID=A0A5C3KXD1_COPMA|nr:thioredoxin [Coprinopsis marcescibilis]
MSTNLHQVNSPDHFKDLLSADLNRVSVINFWAPWAAPCAQMNEVFSELAKKYPATLFLQVHAEDQPDIAESFDVEAVPTFLLLRGHTLLNRIAGADAAALTQAIQKHASTPTYIPLSKTDQAPAKPNGNSAPSTNDDDEETAEQLEDRCRKLMNQSKVVLFMKGNPETPRCGFSRKIVALLQEQHVPFTTFDILSDERVRQALKTINDWPTYPQLIVKGELVGGLDIVKEMADNGELAEIVGS